MDYKEKALSLGRKKYGDDLHVVKHLGDDTYELVSMATPQMEKVGDGFEYPIFCVNKNTGSEMLLAGVLSLDDTPEFSNIALNRLTVR